MVCRSRHGDRRHHVPRRARRVSSNADSPAPGLQKQPVRTEMPAALASRATARSSTTAPWSSVKLNATVPPRAGPSTGPYTRTIGAPLLCLRCVRPSSSQLVR